MWLPGIGKHLTPFSSIFLETFSTTVRRIPQFPEGREGPERATGFKDKEVTGDTSEQCNPKLAALLLCSRAFPRLSHGYTTQHMGPGVCFSGPRYFAESIQGAFQKTGVKAEAVDRVYVGNSDPDVSRCLQASACGGGEAVNRLALGSRSGTLQAQDSVDLSETQLMTYHDISNSSKSNL